MAKSVGKYTGLQYRPLEGDVSADILNAEDQEFRHRQEKRFDDELAERKEEKIRQALAKVKSLSLFNTGSETIQGTLADSVAVAEAEIPTLFDTIYDRNASRKDKTSAQLKLDYLQSPTGFVNDLKTMVSGVVGEYAQYTANKGKHGGFFEDADYEKRFQHGYKGLTISLDDNLKPTMLFHETGEDLDNDGIIDVETLDSFDALHKKEKFQKFVDYEKSVSDVAKKIETFKTGTDNGVTRNTKDIINSKQFEDYVTRLLYNDDKTPSDNMKSFAKLRNLDVNDPNVQKEIENSFKNDVNLQVKQSDVTEVDGGTALSYKKYDDENKPTELGGKTTPTDRTFSIHGKDIEKDKVFAVSFDNAKVIPALKTVEGKTISNFTTHNVTRDKNGRMIVEGSYQTAKSISMKIQDADKVINDYETQAPEDRERSQEEIKQILLAKQQAEEAGENTFTVSLPSVNRRKDISVTDEDELLIAKSLNMTVEELNGQIYKPKKEDEKKEDDFKWEDQ